MATEEYATGTPNHIYNAVTALSNILEAGSQYETYISDAEQAGDDELVEFFRQAQQDDQDRAEQLKQLLDTRIVS